VWCAANLLLFWACAAQAVQIGDPLAAALEELRASGLQLIFSSALIEPSFTVNVEPGPGPAEEIARRILAPYGLALDAVRPGLFAVVKRAAAETAAAAAPRGAAAQKPVEPTPLPEVNVYASRYEIEAQPVRAQAQFTREDLDALPGLNEDVLRVARYLPGTASNALSARSHVRGGREDELAVFFDGVPLFEPFHFKDVQSLFGMLDPQSISTVDFYSGVFPTHFGNRLSGVLDIQPRRWEGDNRHAIGASLLYTQLFTQGRLDSHPIEWLGSVRRGNVDLLAKAFGRDEAEPEFLDALGRLQLDLAGRSTLAMGWLLLSDGLEAHLESETADIHYRDATGWLTWQSKPDENGRELRATMSRTERHTTREGFVNRVGSAQGGVDDQRRFDTTTARLTGIAPLSDRLRLSGGLEWYDYDARYDYTSDVALDPLLAAAFRRPLSISRAEGQSVDGEAYAAYASTLVSLTDRMTLDLGARWDAQRFGAAFEGNQLSPRFSFQFERDPATLLRLSWGRLTQTQRPDELAVQDGDQLFHPAQRAEQIVASVERRPSRNMLWRLEAFEKHVYNPAPSYENLLDPFALLPELEVDRVRIQPDRSRTQGAELSLRWELPPTWLGWVSYSWSHAVDRFDGVIVPRTWDQRHSVAAGLNWTRGQWGLSANLLGHTGWQRNDLRVDAASVIELAPRNSNSWPAYFSFDLRGTWVHPLPVGALQVFMEVDNATNRNNPCCSDYRAVESTPGVRLSRDTSGWLPRIYMLGVTWQLQ
jgi:hypothetical protein